MATGCEASTVAVAAAALTRKAVLKVEPLVGGANSRVFRVDTAERSYLFKIYPRFSDDPRDRLTTEYNSFAFLARRGIKSVPAPIAFDEAAGFALYEWIPGRPIGAPSPADIDLAIDFIADLDHLRRDPMAKALPLASEACLAPADIVSQTTERLARLRQAPDGGPGFAALLGDLDRAIGVCGPASEFALQDAGIKFDHPIEHGRRCLSPSDFGFHNALRRNDGSIAWIDFEYFGWDDPAKMISDFILHPGMSLPSDLAERFRVGSIARFPGDSALSLRVVALIPLFGLRWCAILLNEFLPERRNNLEADGLARIRGRQLEKARTMLDSVYLLKSSLRP